MNDVTITDKTKSLFQGLEETKLRNIIFGALKKGAYVLQQNTISSLRTKANITGKSNEKFGGGKSITENVRMKGHKDYLEVTVNILKDPRLIWLEKGTKIRQSKLGNRGQITPRNFFLEARMNETPIQQAIDNQINKSLQRIKV